MVEYFNQACNMVIVDVDTTWTSYLMPLWKTELIAHDLDVSQVSDYDLTWDELYQMLLLEVERRHALTDVTSVNMRWLYETVVAIKQDSIDPATNKLINEVIEYTKRKEDLDKREAALNVQETLGNKTAGLNFSKRED